MKNAREEAVDGSHEAKMWPQWTARRQTKVTSESKRAIPGEKGRDERTQLYKAAPAR